jgi:two-component system response regulator AtoC
MTVVLENLAMGDPQATAVASDHSGRRVLIADPDEESRGHLRELLGAEPGLEVQAVGDGREALQRLLAGDVSLLLTELRLPHADGLQLLKEVRERGLPVTTVVLAAGAGIDDAVQALRLGAADFLARPLDPDRLRGVLRQALAERSAQDDAAQVRARLRQRYGFRDLLGKDPRMQAIFELIHQAAHTSAPVLLEGETGTGKETLARALHEAAADVRRGPFVIVNCAALPENLLECDWFGHEAGAFPGAAAARPGRFEQANGGTLFLDEVGDIPPPLQARLLQFLQERRCERVGGGAAVATDVRVVSAGTRPLRQLVQQNRFREDLFYRLNVITIELPPLRERPEDVPLLAAHFCARYTPAGERPRQLAPEVVEALLRYHWPGNVRELENAVERACIVSREPVIRKEHLPAAVLSEAPAAWPPFAIDLNRPLPQLLRDAVASIEKHYLSQALKKTHGHVSRCAQICGLSRRSVTAKIAEYGLDKNAFKWA